MSVLLIIGVLVLSVIFAEIVSIFIFGCLCSLFISPNALFIFPEIVKPFPAIFDIISIASLVEFCLMFTKPSLPDEKD